MLIGCDHMRPHWINGEHDVQAKLGEIIARLDPAVLAVLINSLEE